MLNHDGSILIPFEYNELSYFSEGLAAARKITINDYGNETAEDWGYINENNEVVIPFQFYRYAGDFSGGQAVVNNFNIPDSNYGNYDQIIDTAGTVIWSQNGRVYNNNGTYYTYRQAGNNNHTILYTADGKEIDSYYYDFGAFHNPYSGLSDRSFSEGLYARPQYRYEEVEPTEERNGYTDQIFEGYVYVDRNGEPAVPGAYQYAKSFRNGLATVCVGGKWGVINKEGDVIVPFEYDTVLSSEDPDVYTPPISYFSDEGVAAIHQNGKWSYIRSDGVTYEKIILSKDHPKVFYDEIESASGPYQFVKKENLWGVAYLDHITLRDGDGKIPLTHGIVMDRCRPYVSMAELADHLGWAWHYDYVRDAAAVSVPADGETVMVIEFTLGSSAVTAGDESHLFGSTFSRGLHDQAHIVPAIFCRINRHELPVVKHLYCLYTFFKHPDLIE